MSEQKKYFLKIIIPNYNNYIYIKKCLDSILNQTFTDWFCIIVDDTSTDKSDKIAEIYERRYPNKFKLIRADKKCYAGGCRNIGLKYGIKSKFTYFIDSDDELASRDSFETIHNHSFSNPDIIECGYIEKNNQCEKTVNVYKKNIRDLLFCGVQPWKHCINSKFDYIEFKENRVKCNDMIWGINLFDVIDENKITYTNKPIYKYNIVSNTSIQHSEKKHNINAINSLYLLIDDLKDLRCSKKHTNEFIEKKNQELTRVYSKYKKIELQDLAENSYVISIDDDRLNIFYKIFNQKFPNFTYPKLFKGSTNKNLTGPQNCTRSHIGVIKTAKRLKLPYVMIFEDDAFPRVDISEKLSLYLSYIPKDTKILLLGWSNHSNSKIYYKPQQQFNDHVNRIQTNICGSHAYIIFENAYDEYLNYFVKNPNGTADCGVFLSLSPSYITGEPLFIQFSKTKSMNNHIGYIYYGNNETPPEGFEEVKI